MEEYSFRNFFYRLPQSFVKVFRGRNLYWHALAIAATTLLVLSGADWQYFKFWNGGAVQRLLFVGVALGGLVPIFVPLGLWLYARAKKRAKAAYAAFALGQGAIAGYLISVFYKVFTGRAHPGLHAAALTDISRQFHFGILQGGIFWGWPSSHSAVAFGMAFALMALFPHNKPLKIVAIVYALFIGVAVSMSIHWLSDFAAGAILGGLAGYTAGSALRSHFNSP